MKRALPSVLLILYGSAWAQVPLAYPGAVPVLMSPDTPASADVIPQAYFTTADAPEQVLAFFLQAWSERGVPVDFERNPDGASVVSAFFTRAGLHQYAVALPHRSGTLVFTGVTPGLNATGPLPMASSEPQSREGAR